MRWVARGTECGANGKASSSSPSLEPSEGWIAKGLKTLRLLDHFENMAEVGCDRLYIHKSSSFLLVEAFVHSLSSGNYYC